MTGVYKRNQKKFGVFTIGVFLKEIRERLVDERLINIIGWAGAHVVAAGIVQDLQAKKEVSAKTNQNAVFVNSCRFLFAALCERFRTLLLENFWYLVQKSAFPKAKQESSKHRS